ncbi:DUF1513 domain-containing protein [Halocynthiibacter sp.]|uniref:DUF1513 domain-containing protein n=1 Tax=Halocynthiibacter sp. TaxID=1979210 RepID=UPI003C5E064F
MKSTRRGFLTGLLAAGAVPSATWADAGNPTWLSAARNRDGNYVLAGLASDDSQRFSIALPGRGHAATAHPTRPEAIAFARRPGTFALVIDCAAGREIARLEAPDGRHFYGHGVFSKDGNLLFTPENDYDNGVGIIGVWDRAAHWARVGEFSSGGTGPHEIIRLPDQDILVVANGGIETHPDTGRAKLNIPDMRPNLSYLSTTGQILDQVEPEETEYMNSLRHLAVRADGLVACALQWQGERFAAPPLLALHRQGEALNFAQATEAQHQQMHGYGGSVSFSGDGSQIAVTSPRGGVLQVFDADGAFYHQHHLPDVCGVAPDRQGGFLVTAGTGDIARVQGTDLQIVSRHGVQWDNHLVPV